MKPEDRLCNEAKKQIAIVREDEDLSEVQERSLSVAESLVEVVASELEAPCQHRLADAEPRALEVEMEAVR